MSISKFFSDKSPDSRRTLTFVAVAGVCLVITGIIEWSSRPANIEEFGRLGEKFYPEFTDPTRATSLEVYAIDTENVRPLEFRVEQLPNGRWVIPSHHNYPADAEEQLAKTAASIIGVERDAMVTRWEADHAELKVVNPKQEAFQAGDVEGVGKRIILRGENDAVLADYIIGKEADAGGQAEEDQYYVRRPDEDEVYIARLNIDLSTRFVDWVDTELLDVEAMDIREITVNDYSFDEMRGQVTNREISTLTRDGSADPWGMKELEDETKEVDEEALRETVNAVAGLEMVGVRPKQKGLTPDLKLDRDALKSQDDLNRLQSDLMAKGFLLQPRESGDPDDLRLLAREGEMALGASDGLYYQLHFGRTFTGSQEELEIGLSSSDGEDDDEDATSGKDAGSEEAGSEDTKKADSETDGDSEEGDEEDAESDSGKPGRYVFLRVEFDKRYVDEPVKPEEPEEPAELNQAAESKEEDTDQTKKNATPKEPANKENDSDESDGQSDDASDEPSDDEPPADSDEASDEPSDDESPDDSDEASDEPSDDEPPAESDEASDEPSDDESPDESDEASDEPSDDESPDESDEASDDESDSDSDAESDEASAEESGESDGDPESDEESSKKEDTAKTEEALAKARAEYQEAMQEYEAKLKQYESELKEYNEKIENGKEKAEELNRRFADWYYVIPGESYDKLRLSRADLIKEKGEDEEEEAGGAPKKMPGGLPGGGMMPKMPPGVKKQ
ncbi:MAG: hypothetical protein ACQESR_05690 [Planctomycetota bacterium]